MIKEIACAVFILAAALEILSAERCRRDPVKCQDRFMAENGWSRSFFGYFYFFGRAKAAREAIIQNAKLRHWFIIEIYLRATALIILGIIILIILP